MNCPICNSISTLIKSHPKKRYCKCTIINYVFNTNHINNININHNNINYLITYSNVSKMNYSTTTLDNIYEYRLSSHHFSKNPINVPIFSSTEDLFKNNKYKQLVKVSFNFLKTQLLK